jgi:hypothetical protein
MVRAELAARFPAGMGSYVLWATAGDGYALHCSDEGAPRSSSPRETRPPSRRAATARSSIARAALPLAA